jgi:hypothetical protein
MKTRFQATIGIQSQRGIHFGTTDSIKGRVIQFSSPVEFDEHEEVTLKIELPDGAEWVLAEARIMRTAPSKRDETTRCMARISMMSPSHRARLQKYRSVEQARNAGPAMEQPISLHEPTISLSTDGRNLTAKWQDPRAFRRDWALHISRGRLPAQGVPPHRRAFMMRIMMPNGYVASFPAEIGEKLKDGWLVRFLVPHDAFARMRTYAEVRRKRRVV